MDGAAENLYSSGQGAKMQGLSGATAISMLKSVPGPIVVLDLAWLMTTVFFLSCQCPEDETRAPLSSIPDDDDDARHSARRPTTSHQPPQPQPQAPDTTAMPCHAIGQVGEKKIFQQTSDLGAAPSSDCNTHIGDSSRPVLANMTWLRLWQDKQKQVVLFSSTAIALYGSVLWPAGCMLAATHH